MINVPDLELIAMWLVLCEALDSMNADKGFAKRHTEEIAAYKRLHAKLFQEAQRRGIEDSLTGHLDWTEVAK